MTLLNSTKIIKHYFERLSFAILTKGKISLKTIFKMVKTTNFFFFKLTNTFDFQSKTFQNN